MKTLLFLRHGKSDWDAAFGHDHARPINKRGRKAAQRMGRFLVEAGAVPDFIITSSAVRARETLAQAREAGEWVDVPEQVTDALYEATPAEVLEVIRRAPAEAERLLLVGHEPTWSGMVSRLIGGGAVKMGTATLARVDISVEAWSRVAFGWGHLVWLVPPKSLE